MARRYEVEHGGGIFCSRSCSHLYHRKDKTLKNRLICKHCGKEYYKIPSHSIKSKYCSKKCMNEARRKPYIKRVLTSEQRRMAYKYAIIWNKKIKEKIENVFGNKCKICIREHRKLCYHEKNGEKHLKSGLSYIYNNPEKFTRLCEQCHRGVHFLMDVLGWKWTEIEKFLRENKVEI